MTPRGTKYSDAYAKAYSFDEIVEEMFSCLVIEDPISLMQDAAKKDFMINPS